MFKKIQKMISSEELKALYPVKDRAFKMQRDNEIKAALEGRNNKFLVILGPCSLDSEQGIFEYLSALKNFEELVKQKILLIPRLFSAKPRTFNGYRGLMHEEDGLIKTRKILTSAINDFGLSGADELLYLFSYEYFEDVISYYTIGARSAVNQEHRFFASGIDVAVGIKNPLNGDLKLLENSIAIAKNPSSFYSNGYMVETNGNPYAHGILRGFQNSLGAHFNNMAEARRLRNSSIIIDLGHSNSKKSHTVMKQNYKHILSLLSNKNIKGIMFESYLKEGRSDEPIFGQSITDACIGLKDTKKILLDLYERL
ncbi:MAG: 3-deoxy-7-phosphoheptulonate synthase [Firmicutes bacterium]|nr:3-deoxy-7-phosphoheptulonate synthase [Bacillota bacterium]